MVAPARWHAEAADVPGAVLGIWVDGEQIVVPHGVLSTATGVETTVDSAVQIGSITKLWTATMIMQLVDEGRAKLDSTVAEHACRLAGRHLGSDAQHRSGRTGHAGRR